ncbi:MAG: hypothetical protein AAF556_12725, partial [Pseudomonadota bacterium]
MKRSPRKIPNLPTAALWLALVALLLHLIPATAQAQPVPPWYWRLQNPITAAFRAEVELEVNGESLTFERNIGCRGTQEGVGGRPDSFVMSQRVEHPQTGQEEAVIVHLPNGCKMLRLYARH